MYVVPRARWPATPGYIQRNHKIYMQYVSIHTRLCVCTYKNEHICSCLYGYVGATIPGYVQRYLTVSMQYVNIYIHVYVCAHIEMGIYVRVYTVMSVLQHQDTYREITRYICNM